MIKQIILVGAALLLSGCATLPRSGPTDQRIMSSAAAKLTREDVYSTLQYALVDIDQVVLDRIPDYSVGSLNASFGMGQTSPALIKIGVGDVVQVTVFESEDGGLFIPEGGGGTAGNYVTFPAQAVDASGVVTVPFAGTVNAVGLSVPQLQDAIKARLENRAIDPQVVVSLTNRTATEITVLGDVNAPQKLAVNEAGDRILDVLARAGGIKAAPFETFVSITRGGQTGEIYFNELIDRSQENIFLRPGDVVFVSSEKRVFTAFGSTGLTGEFDFGAESIQLDRAVAKAGGLLDGRADPRQVFLYRIESRATLQSIGVDLSAFPANQHSIPTVFRANFADPASFFYAKEFEMRDGDVIYISNADSVEVLKVLDVFNSVVTVGNNAVIAGRNVTNTPVALVD